VSAGDGRSEEQYNARASRYSKPEHTDVHDMGSRLLELLQDLVVVLLTITLLGLALVFLWRVWQEILGAGDLQQAISDIIFVFISVELYRLSVHYLRYHRVDLNTLVEVGVAAIIQKVILVGVDKFTIEQLAGIALVLLVLCAILWVYLWDRRSGNPLTSPDAEAVADLVPGARKNREERHVANSPRDRRPAG
jgi:uncharacterized membrane protein (DUF373 family)